METFSVELPNGQVIDGVPKGTSKEEVMRKAIQSGLATPQDFGEDPAQQLVEGQPTSVEQSEYELDTMPMEDLDPDDVRFDLKVRDRKRAIERQIQAEKMPGRIDAAAKHIAENKFAYTLGVLGIAGGPAGAAWASALGTAFDTAYNTHAEKGEIDVEQVLIDSAVSLGIDYATLGLTKITPGLKALLSDAILKGKDPKVLVKALAKDKASDFLTKEGLKESQQVINQMAPGATLTPSRVGAEGVFTSVAEGLGRSGLLSGQKFVQNQNRIYRTGKENIEKLFDPNVVKVTSEDVGRMFVDRVDAAKKDLSNNYGESLDVIRKTLSEGVQSKKQIKSSVITDSIEKWLQSKPNMDKDGISKLEPKAQEAVRTLLSRYKDKETVSSEQLIEIHGAINRLTGNLNLIGGDSYNPVAARQLTDLANTIKGDTLVELRKLGKAGSEAANKFKGLQAHYSKTTENLMPTINEKFIKGVDKEGYAQIARMFDETSSPQRIGAAFRQLDTAFAQLNRNVTNAEKRKMAVQDLNQAKDIIRKRYLENQLSSLNRVKNNGEDFVRLASKLNDADEAARVRAVLGQERYNSFRKIVNAVASSVDDETLGAGLLALRSAEIGAGKEVVRSTSDVTLFGSAASLGTFVLGVPTLLANVTLDPKKVNRLLGITDQIKKEGGLTPKIRKSLTLLVNDVYKTFDEEDKKRADDLISVMLNQEVVGNQETNE